MLPFVGELKKRFTLWHNEQQNTRGTAWESRYKSVLVEDLFEALSTVGAYIDLNAARAQLIKDPKNYRFCGFAQAEKGKCRSSRRIMSMYGEERFSYDRARTAYRIILYSKGRNPKGESSKAIKESSPQSWHREYWIPAVKRVLEITLILLYDI